MHAPQRFFKAWIGTTLVLAAYIGIVSLFVDDFATAVWLIGAPIALFKIMLVGSGLAFLIWFVAARRSPATLQPA